MKPIKLRIENAGLRANTMINKSIITIIMMTFIFTTITIPRNKLLITSGLVKMVG